jgi:hypothetical protein
MTNEALKMAIDALEMAHDLQLTGILSFKKYKLNSDVDIIKKLEKTLNACKEALEQFAFMDEVKYGQSFMLDGKHVPLETVYKQPAQKYETWIDVNDKLPEPEINFLSFSETYGYQVSMYSNNPFNSTLLPTFEKLKIDKWMPIPVYTQPHQWQGLTDDEIQAIRIKTFDAVATNYEAYRAIEQALKEKNHG